jgi:hypothetical protein
MHDAYVFKESPDAQHNRITVKSCIRTDLSKSFRRLSIRAVHRHFTLSKDLISVPPKDLRSKHQQTHCI